MSIYHALISALSTHMIHINLNMIFYKHVEHSPTKTIFMKYYTYVNRYIYFRVDLCVVTPVDELKGHWAVYAEKEEKN